MEIKGRYFLFLSLVLVFFVGTMFAGKFTGKFTSTTGDLEVTSNFNGNSTYKARVEKCNSLTADNCTGGYTKINDYRVTPFVLNLKPTLYRVVFVKGIVPQFTKEVNVVAGTLINVNYNYSTCSDGLKNGDETDVDCGGSCTTKCGLNKGCKTDTDCVSNQLCYQPTKTCQAGYFTCNKVDLKTTKTQTYRQNSQISYGYWNYLDGTCSSTTNTTNATMMTNTTVFNCKSAGPVLTWAEVGPVSTYPAC